MLQAAVDPRDDHLPSAHAPNGLLRYELRRDVVRPTTQRSSVRISPHP